MEWHKITERTEYVSIGESLAAVYHLGGGDRVVVIDAGAVECPEFVEDMKERGLSVAALLLSHLHFDHISTAGLIYEAYNMPSYAHYLEERETEFPTRFFPITPIGHSEPIVIEGERFELLFTPGHTKGHLAFVTPDSVCCVGDAFMSEKVLEASKLPYFLDVDEAIVSMELIRATNYEKYLLCHEAVIGRDELERVIDLNIERELELYRRILDFVTEPMDMEEAVTGFMKSCGIRNKFILEFEGYRGTVKSRLRALDKAGELKLENGFIYPL